MDTQELQILIDESPLRLMVKQEIERPEAWYEKLLKHANRTRDFKADHSKWKESLMMIALMMLDYTSETKCLFNNHQQMVIEHIKDRLNDDPILPEDCYYD